MCSLFIKFGVIKYDEMFEGAPKAFRAQDRANYYCVPSCGGLVGARKYIDTTVVTFFAEEMNYPSFPRPIPSNQRFPRHTPQGA